MVETKRCSTCGLIRPLSDFNVMRRAADGRQARCRECSRRWYVENRLEHRANVRRRNDRVRAENKQRLAAHFLEHPCVDCGESDVRVLDFDHDDPADKLGEIGRLIAEAMSWHRIAAEIAKCSVRCANCHRRRTADEGGYWRSPVEHARRAVAAQRAQDRLEGLLG